MDTLEYPEFYIYIHIVMYGDLDYYFIASLTIKTINIQILCSKQKYM